MSTSKLMDKTHASRSLPLIQKPVAVRQRSPQQIFTLKLLAVAL